jgi:hypothetical protein
LFCGLFSSAEILPFVFFPHPPFRLTFQFFCSSFVEILRLFLFFIR